MRVTKDDERARRICSLALEFMNARSPVPSSTLARSFYPDLSPDSFRRSFSRDRAVLAACGLRVVEAGRTGGEAAWGIDERRSYAEGVELAPSEAGALEVACQGLLEDPTFPLAEDLRLALAKVARAFSDAPALAAAPAHGEPRALSSIRRALVEGRCIECSYTDARGATTRRRLAPYGLFGLRGALYLVAADAIKESSRPAEPRTFRIDRFDDARVLDDVPCEVPEGFSVLAWRRLPFQLGGRPQAVTFEVPAERLGAVREAALGQGTFSQGGGSARWTVEAGDLAAAASWAVSQAIVPVDPPELVAAWRRALKGVLGDAS